MGSSSSRHWARAISLGIAAGLVALGPGPAHASNTGKPRVPPSFLGPACIETVDRSVSPLWSFDVGIPYEDTGLTEDEPPDSRTFQFFGLCRSPGPLELLPAWVEPADAMAAAALDPTVEVPGPGQTLADSEAWAGCVEWITPTPARMPITCADTMGGGTWDTSAVPTGAYAIWGYTYEPSLNLWTPRDGVVRVIDGDDASAGPAVSFSWPLTEVTAGLYAGVRVAGCVAGMEGTTLTVAWASASALADQGDAAWQPFMEDPEPGGTFDAVLVPPAEVEYEALFFRADVVDPQGRGFTTYTRERVVFLSGCDDPSGGARSLPDECGVGSGSPPVPEGERGGGGCEQNETGAVDETGGEPLTGGTSGSSSTGDAPAMGGGGEGCGCRHHPPGPWAWAWLCVPAVWRRRR